MNATRTWQEISGRPARIAGKPAASASAEMSHRAYRGVRISWAEFLRQHPERCATRRADNDNLTHTGALNTLAERPEAQIIDVAFCATNAYQQHIGTE